LEGILKEAAKEGGRNTFCPFYQRNNDKHAALSATMSIWV